MPAKVVTGVTWDLSVLEKIIGGGGAQLFRVPMWTEADILQNAAEADAVVAGVIEPFTAKVLQGMPQCKIISRVGIGVDNINVEEATRLGIPVTLVLDAQSQEVSDYALACILAFNRRLIPLSRAVAAGVWRPGSKELIQARGKMFRLNRQTVGIIGMGRIGLLLVQKTKALHIRVLVYDPYVPPEFVQTTGAEVADLDRLLREADYVSVHAPLNPQTKKLLGAEAFRKMKPTAYLINAARGGLVDEKALVQAITEGWIAGAALDVTDPEPPSPENPLLKLDQVLATGHSSFYSDSYLLETQETCAEQILAALQGRWPRNLANPEVQKQASRRVGA
jgi:D-3-phosphoglycerate dehydrogenase